MKLSVVVPARNEERTIGPTLAGIRAQLLKEAIPYEIIVVDDGSSDGTARAVQAVGRPDRSVRLLDNPGPYGFGCAVRRGLDAFEGDAVAIVMADGSDAPEDLVRYFRILETCDCAFGSRFMKGGRTEGYPPFKWALNRLANHAIRLLFGIRYDDVTNAFKAYRADVIRGCRPLLSSHFNLTVELPLKAIVRGFSYEVIPIGWRQRKWGRSGLRLQEMGSRYVFTVLYVWLEKLLSGGRRRRAAG